MGFIHCLSSKVDFLQDLAVGCDFFRRSGLPQRGLNRKAQGNALGITPAISPSPERAKYSQSARSEFEMFSIAPLQGLGTFWHGYSQAVGLGCIIAAPSGRICGGGGPSRTVEIPIAPRTADRRQKKSHPLAVVMIVAGHQNQAWLVLWHDLPDHIAPWGDPLRGMLLHQFKPHSAWRPLLSHCVRVPANAHWTIGKSSLMFMEDLIECILKLQFRQRWPPAGAASR